LKLIFTIIAILISIGALMVSILVYENAKDAKTISEEAKDISEKVLYNQEHADEILAEKIKENTCGAAFIYYDPNQSGSERHEWLGVYLQNDIHLKDLDYLINVFPEYAENNVTIQMAINNTNINIKNLTFGNHSEIPWRNIPKKRSAVNYILSWNNTIWQHSIITGNEISIQVSVNQNQNIIDIPEPKELNYTVYKQVIEQSDKTPMPHCVFLPT
jgi:hypothetical protein